VGKQDLDVAPHQCAGSRIVPDTQLSGKTSRHLLCSIHPILRT